MLTQKRMWITLFLSLLLALALVACGGGGEPAAEEAAEPAGEQVEEAAEEAAEMEEEPAAENLSGTTVTIFGAMVDEDAQNFEESMVPFEERTGIDIQYEGSGDFESLILVRDEGANPPDVAAFPQPGLMRDFAQKGSLVPLHAEAIATVEENYAPIWKDLGSFEGTPYGVFHRVSLKSLVWYPVPEFEEAGYTIPGTWEELMTVSDQMVADGNVPWCIGIESSGATGWVATDWVEDIMLRLHGGDVYDQWVNHEIPFNDPRVKEAVETMGDIWLNPDYVLGSTTGILTIPVGDAAAPMFEESPECYMHRQASWMPAFFPEDTALGEDVNIFGFPQIDPEFGVPALGGGDMYAMFDDRPEVRAVLEYLATGESGEAWAATGGAIFAHQDFDLSIYPNEVARTQAEIIQNAELFRFDASDLMPGAVGAGTFWSGMVDYVNGDDVDGVLQTIEESWPQ